MNQIYKVIWSKTKNCYVVASELAKSCTKSSSQHRITKSVVAGIVACIIGSGIALPVLAADKDTVTSAKANTTKIYLLGHTAAGTAQAKYDSGIYATTTAGQLHVGSLLSAGNVSATNGVFSGAVTVGTADAGKQLTVNGPIKMASYKNSKGTVVGPSLTIGDDSGAGAITVGTANKNGKITVNGTGTFSGKVTVGSFSTSGAVSGGSFSTGGAISGASLSTTNDAVVGSDGTGTLTIGKSSNNSSGNVEGGNLNVYGVLNAKKSVVASNVVKTGAITLNENGFTVTSGALGITNGNINLNSKGKITGLVNGTANTDAVNLGQLNTVQTNLSKVFSGATASGNGTSGMVPAPAAGKQGLFLRGDGTWATPTDKDTTYGSATANALGLVKIGSNITNSSGTISLSKANVVSALGYTPPTQDTTYNAASSNALGLVQIGSNITNTNGVISLTKNNVTSALGYTPPTQDTTYSPASPNTMGVVKIGSNITSNSGVISLSKNNVVSALGYTPPAQDTTYSPASPNTMGVVKIGSNITSNSGVISLTKNNVINALGYTPPTKDTTYVNFKGASGSADGTAGLVPAAKKGQQSLFLRADGTWSNPNATALGASSYAMYANNGVVADMHTETTNGNTNIVFVEDGNVRQKVTLKGTGGTTVTSDTNGVITINSTASGGGSSYSAFTGATSSADGTEGLVKKPVKGDQVKFLRGDGTWATPVDNDTTYSAANTNTLGLVKVGSNITNNGGTISLTKDNVISALGYTPPTTDTNTTYEAANANTLGLVKTGANITNNGGTISLTKNNVISALGYTPATEGASGGGGTTSGGGGTTYDSMTATDLNTGTDTTNKVVSAKVISDYVTTKIRQAEISGDSGSGTGIYDSSTGDQITFAGTQGTKLKNVKNGAVDASSMDAVNGSQLYNVKQSISGYSKDIQNLNSQITSLRSTVSGVQNFNSSFTLLIDTVDVSKVDTSLSNLDANGRQVITNIVSQYMAGQNKPQAPMTPNSLAVTDAGNGSLAVGEGSMVNGSSSIAIGVGNQVNANNAGAFGDPSTINADASYVLGNDDTVNTGAVGSFIVGNNGVSDAEGGLLFGSNTKATTEAVDGLALGNRSEVSARNSIALGADSVADAEDVVSVGNSNLFRKIVNIADGAIAGDSHEAVTGAQLFVTNEKVQQNANAIEENRQAIEKKADIDGGNISVTDWSAKLGIGNIVEGDTGLVTGGTVYNAMQDFKSSSLVKSVDGKITIGADTVDTTIDVSNSNGEARTITGVATDENDATSAANVGYVNQVGASIAQSANAAFQQMNYKINKVGANAAAIASLPTPTFDGDEKWAFSAGVGHYRGETAASAGAFYKPQDNVIVRVGGSFGNGDEMVGAGVSVSLNKAGTPVVSKSQLVKTINAQAERINTQDNTIMAQNREIAAVRAENDAMKQMVLQMREELDVLKNK